MTINYSLRVPTGYSTTTKILSDVEASLLVHHHPEYVRRLVTEHQSGFDHTARLWRVLAFQVWRRDVLPAESQHSFAVAV